MLITIHNLPTSIRYADIKQMLLSKCGLSEIILDNLVNEGTTKKVTVGVAEEGDAAILVRKINGLFLNGYQLYVEKAKQKKPSEQPYRSTKPVERQPDFLSEPMQQPYQDPMVSQDQMMMKMMGGVNPMSNMYYMPVIQPTIPAIPTQNSYMNFGNTAPQITPLLPQYSVGSVNQEQSFGFDPVQPQPSIPERSGDWAPDNNRSRYDSRQSDEPWRGQPKGNNPRRPSPRRNQRPTENFGGHQQIYEPEMSLRNDRDTLDMRRGQPYPDDTRYQRESIRRPRSRSPVMDSHNSYERRVTFDHGVQNTRGIENNFDRGVQNTRGIQNTFDHGVQITFDNNTKSRSNRFERKDVYSQPFFSYDSQNNGFENKPEPLMGNRDRDYDFNRQDKQRNFNQEARFESRNMERNRPPVFEEKSKRSRWQEPDQSVFENPNKKRRVDFKPQMTQEKSVNAFPRRDDRRGPNLDNRNNRSRGPPPQRFNDAKQVREERKIPVAGKNPRYDEPKSKDWKAPGPAARFPKPQNDRPHAAAGPFVKYPKNTVRTPAPPPATAKPPYKTPSLTNLLAKDSTWRGQASSAIAKKMMKHMDVTQMGKNDQILKALKASIKSRINMVLGDKVAVPEEEIVQMYRKQFPETEDQTFFVAVLENLKKEVAESDETPVLESTLESVKKEVQNKIAGKQNKSPGKPQTKIAKEASAPKGTNTDNNINKQQKQLLKQENAEEMFNSLPEALQKAVDEQADLLCDLFMGGCENPDGEDDQKICEKITDIVADDFRKLVRLQLTKRVLDIATFLNVRINAQSKVDKKLLEIFLQDYDLVSFKKSARKLGLYVATLGSYEGYDKLCQMETVEIGGVTLHIKPLHMTGAPPKVKRLTILADRKKFIESQIDQDSENILEKPKTGINNGSVKVKTEKVDEDIDAHEDYDQNIEDFDQTEEGADDQDVPEIDESNLNEDDLEDY